MNRLILASQSPRRKELLAQLGLEFIIHPAVGEELLEEAIFPGEAVQRVALAKAKEVAGHVGRGEDLILAADTMVCLKGRFLGKPSSRKEAKDMLEALSGQKHTVYTGIALVRLGQQEKMLGDFVETQVYFRPLDQGEIDAYIETGEPMDKAGAYGIQGKAAQFVQRIEGDFYNVVGLPLCRLVEMLREMGEVI